MCAPIRAVKPREPGDLSQREFSKPELYLSNANQPLEEVLEELPNRPAWEDFLADRELQGEAPVRAFIDPRSGAATNLVGAFPLIPGRGAGNRVKLQDLAYHIGRPVREVDEATVGEAVAAFVRDHAALLGLDPAQLGEVRSSQVNPNLWQVAIDQTYQGVPVRFARLAATINNGNLVVIGTETWGDVRGLSIVPRVSAANALVAGFGHAGGRAADDEIRRQVRLEILPVAPAEHQDGDRFAGPVGAGYRHRLVWTFAFQRRSEMGLWEVIVDAGSGEVLAFHDINHYSNQTIKGGVYPVTSTEICPTAGTCGTLQSNWPMPFANTGLAVPNDFTNGAGVFNWTGGAAATSLAGKYVGINDSCGAILEGGPGGTINLGGANGQHDCDAAGSSSGNTASSRSAYYELNKIAEQARGWLPSNTWLQAQLPTNVNLNQTCNAYYDYVSVNFFRSGGGCRNTGELAGVFDHEWGHGLDDHDSGGLLSNSSEAYADIAAIFRLQTSCVGHGFFETVNDGCGTTADGTGFNANEAQTGASHCDLDCSGVRDADWNKHADHTPDTALGFVCTSCVVDGFGPCGRQVHCAAAPSRQAAWDLVARDLQQAPFNLDSQTAFLIGNRLFYQGSGNIGSWHACVCGGSSSGCGATNAYMQWLSADDDNGNLSDGTPHMTAIYNAFNRHGIACLVPTPTNAGCAGGPTAASTLTGTPGSYSAGLSWTAVASASKYWVFRSEGHAGCNFGKTKIAETAGLSFTDTEVAPGRSYSYNVVAAGSSPACHGIVSNCATVVPEGLGSACQTLTLSHTGNGADPVPLPDHSDGCPTGQFHPGDLIQLTADPDPSYAVQGWTGTNNDASSSETNFVTMPDAPHAATVHYFQPFVVASFNFESDPGVIATGLWHRTAACRAGDSGHSLPVALYYGVDAQCDYDAGDTNGTATLPVVHLEGQPAPIRLNFNYFLDTEGLSPYDDARIEISVDGGPYQALAGNHPGAGAATLADPSGTWKSATVDLSSHSGSAVQLRFRFDTLDGILNEFDGFYVDDVQVTSICDLPDENIVLPGQTVSTTQAYEACRTITAGPSYIVGATGNVTFEARERVSLKPGFKVVPGGVLKVVVP
jgi:hypothetical protein